jgi:replication factor C subunit 1
MYTNKYKPRVLEEVVGHAEHIRTLKRWINGWTTNGKGSHAFCSGPPGIGKTTIAYLLGAQAGYTVKEWNASDLRSASAFQSLAVGNNRRLDEHLMILMDEVDGLADHGGIGALADLLRKSNVPILCIANERPPKLKPIIQLCAPVLVFRPLSQTELGTILSKADRTHIKEHNRIIEAANGDARAALNALQYRSSAPSSTQGNGSKDLHYDIFTAAQAVFNKDNSYSDAEIAAHSDYSMIPAMVEEGYVAASKSLKQVLRAADYITHGTILQERTHRTQDWSTLPYTIASTIAAARSTTGPTPYNLFPSWLGKNSTFLKNTRTIRSISAHMGYTTRDARLDIFPHIDTYILGKPFKAADSVAMLDTLHITRDDYMDGIRNITFDPADIPTKDKSALTRAYNKVHKGKSTPIPTDETDE